MRKMGQLISYEPILQGYQISNWNSITDADGSSCSQKGKLGKVLLLLAWAGVRAPDRSVLSQKKRFTFLCHIPILIAINLIVDDLGYTV